MSLRCAGAEGHHSLVYQGLTSLGPLSGNQEQTHRLSRSRQLIKHRCQRNDSAYLLTSKVRQKLRKPPVRADCSVKRVVEI